MHSYKIETGVVTTAVVNDKQIASTLAPFSSWLNSNCKLFVVIGGWYCGDKTMQFKKGMHVFSIGQFKEHNWHITIGSISAILVD